MAIVNLYRSKEQPVAKRNAVSFTASESWVLILDSFSTPIQAQAAIIGLEDDNIYDFLIVGQTHPNLTALTVTGYSISKAIDDTYTKFIVITTLNNDTNSINRSVKPARAQDSYNFSNADVEVQVTNATANSKSTTANIKAKSGEAIENTNGRGILVFETKSVTRAVITRNEDDYDLRDAAKHVGKVNSGSVSITGSTFKPGTCKLVKWAGADAYDSDGRLYWRVTYEILITDDPSFFERNYIMRGVVDGNGKPADIASGYISDTEYKLDDEGNFLSLKDQSDPTKFTSKSFPTLESSAWGPAVRLQSSPNRNITTLTGDSGFGLVQ